VFSSINILPAAGALQFMEALRKMATPDILKVPHRPVQCLALVVGSLWFEGSLHDSTLARQSLLPLMPRGDPVRFIRNTSPSKPKDSISILSKTQGGDPRTSPHLSRECCLDSESSPSRVCHSDAHRSIPLPVPVDESLRSPASGKALRGTCLGLLYSSQPNRAGWRLALPPSLP